MDRSEGERRAARATRRQRRRKLQILRFAAGGKAHSFRCGSFPHRTRGRRRWASAGAPEVGERTAPYGRAAAPENRSRPQGPPLQ